MREIHTTGMASDINDMLAAAELTLECGSSTLAANRTSSLRAAIN